jgi:hypothetical protein
VNCRRIWGFHRTNRAWCIAMDPIARNFMSEISQRRKKTGPADEVRNAINYDLVPQASISAV